MPGPDREWLTAEVARLNRALVDAHVQIGKEHDALAAARRECEGLRKALTAFRRLHKKCSKGPTREGRCQPCRDADAALAAHGDGEEPDPSLDDGSFYEQGGGGHDD